MASIQRPLPPVFYPSALVNFHLRFDEALLPVAGPQAQSVDDLVTKPNTAAIKPKAADRPSIISGQNDDLSFVLGRIPQTMNVELTGYRQAWHFDMMFEYQDLPIDPRLLRAASVDIYLDTVAASEFGAGMTQRLPSNNFSNLGNAGRSRVTGSTRRRSMLQPSDDNLVLVGTVDDACSEFSKDSSMIHIVGRDLRGILIDSKITNLALMSKLDLSQPINKVVRQILDRHPMGDQFVVEALEEDWEDQKIPSPGAVDGITRVNFRSDGMGNPVLAPPGAENLSYWDLITNYCFLVGAIPYFHVRRLRIRPARSMFDDVKNNNADSKLKSPFKDNQARHVDGVPIDWKIRKIVYGRDVHNLKFERKYNYGIKPKIVEVVCMDTSNPKRGLNKLLTARWPDKESYKEKKVTRASVINVAASGTHADSEVLKIPVHGIRDVKILRRIAKDIYEELGRGEMGGSCETESLASFGGDNQDPDLIHLKPGDTVELLTDVRLLSSQLPLVNEFTDHQRRSFEEEVAAINLRLGDEKLARAIVATNRAFGLQRFFRVANVKFRWSANSGISIAFDYQNYVEARNLEPLPANPITKKPVLETASVQPK